MKVSDIKRALTKLGFFNGPVSDTSDIAYRDAVKTFQKSVHLTPDGIVGQQTIGALRAKGVLPPSDNEVPGQVIANRPIHTIVVHCTATPEGRFESVADITAMHKARGFTTIGYHFLVYLDGTVHIGRPINQVGAHVSGHNVGTVAISYVGGVDKQGKAKDTRTPGQKEGIINTIRMLVRDYPKIRAVVGHRDLSPDTDHDGVVEPHEWVKVCPCFNAIPEYGHLLRRTMDAPTQTFGLADMPEADRLVPRDAPIPGIKVFEPAPVSGASKGGPLPPFSQQERVGPAIEKPRTEVRGVEIKGEFEDKAEDVGSLPEPPKPAQKSLAMMGSFVALAFSLLGVAGVAYTQQDVATWTEIITKASPYMAAAGASIVSMVGTWRRKAPIKGGPADPSRLP